MSFYQVRGCLSASSLRCLHSCPVLWPPHQWVCPEEAEPLLHLFEFWFCWQNGNAASDWLERRHQVENLRPFQNRQWDLPRWFRVLSLVPQPARPQRDFRWYETLLSLSSYCLLFHLIFVYIWSQYGGTLCICLHHSRAEKCVFRAGKRPEEDPLGPVPACDRSAFPDCSWL